MTRPRSDFLQTLPLVLALAALMAVTTGFRAEAAPPASPTPLASPVPASPEPEASPASLESELDGVMKLFAEKKHNEAFPAAERFLTIDERPLAERQVVKRSRLILERFDTIKKSLPQPADPFDSSMGQLLFSAAKGLESAGEIAEATKVFERIVAEYPKAQFEGETNELIAKLATEQIQWHKEKHPWVVPDSATVLKKLREALAKHDKAQLAALIARKGFWSGPFQSEGGPDDPERVLKHLETCWPKEKLQIADQTEAFSDAERQLFLKTSGWTGQHPEIYFICEKVPGGWHWSAVALALPPAPDSAEDGRPFDGSPGAPAPSADASPAPSASPVAETPVPPASPRGASPSPAPSASPGK